MRAGACGLLFVVLIVMVIVCCGRRIGRSVLSLTPCSHKTKWLLQGMLECIRQTIAYPRGNGFSLRCTQPVVTCRGIDPESTNDDKHEPHLSGQADRTRRSTARQSRNARCPDGERRAPLPCAISQRPARHRHAALAVVADPAWRDPAAEAAAGH